MTPVPDPTRAKLFCFSFFFKQKTAYEIKECDWNSDVCSSDLSVRLFVPNGNIGRMGARTAQKVRHLSHRRHRDGPGWRSSAPAAETKENPADSQCVTII